MEIRLLPSSFEADGTASQRQHTSCLLVNDSVAIDAGSLAQAATSDNCEKIRDIVLTHAHLDHIAGLPLFIDDLFANLEEPIRIHASRDVINTLEKDIFNWSVYPRFSELKNEFGPVIEYKELVAGVSATIKGLDFRPIMVNHKVPSTGFIVSDGRRKLALTGDTAEMDEFWDEVNALSDLNALLVECAFPDSIHELAAISHHLTPSMLRTELLKFHHSKTPIYVFNIKPRYRDDVVRELAQLNLLNLEIMPVGSTVII